jgi:hypothetical protein
MMFFMGASQNGSRSIRGFHAPPVTHFRTWAENRELDPSEQGSNWEHQGITG